MDGRVRIIFEGVIIKPILQNNRRGNRSRSIKLSFFCFIFCLSAGCSVSIEKVQPPVKLNPTFSDSGWLKPADKWWLAFNDQVLNRLCEKALGGNFSLLAAYNRLDQAKAIAKKSGADLIPQVNGSLLTTGSTGQSSSLNDFAVGLAASYELDLWGRIRTALNAAKLDVMGAEEDIDAAAISLTAEIATAWYRLVEQRQQLKLLERQIEVNRNNVALITVRFRGAQASAADVFQQQQLLESVIGSRYTVLATIAVLENQLAVLTGSSPGTYFLPVVEEFPSLSSLPSTGLSVDVMQRRPDIRKAYYAVQAADQRIASAIADRYPKFSLSATVEASSPNFQSVLNNWLATIAGNIVLPIIDGRRRVAEVERTQAVSAEALNNYATLLLNAVNEVENALVQEQQQRLFVDNLELQVKLAREASSLIRLRYINGAMDFLRVLSAILSQQSLERSLLQNRQQLIAYRISLYRALAGKFPLPDLAGKSINVQETH
ncbi:MAG: efflux transporter outer membrane subunit [Methylococcaceae bacterium]|nr:efflux transporter outer membrane subunit [Methylococcaceae bacterium]